MLTLPLLSVITPTRGRPQLLAHCIAGVRRQDLPVQHVVVSDGPDPVTEALCRHYGVTYAACPAPTDNFGNSPRDLGVGLAQAEHLVFWDDDNLFLPHAARELLTTVRGVDLGVVQIEHWHRRRNLMRVIPEVWNGEFRGFHIDTACFCVRTDFWLAHGLSWAAARPLEPYSADHTLCEKMRHLGARIRFNPTVIATHI